jgi:hypothetical protein
MDKDFLREAYRRTRKDGAPGLNGVKAKDYAIHLEDNLDGLYQRLKGGRYVAPPIKRVWIDKDGGKKRLIGIAEFEDKIVQKAVSMLVSGGPNLRINGEQDRPPDKPLHWPVERSSKWNVLIPTGLIERIGLDATAFSQL